MFLNLLNDEEKSCFLKLAISIIQEDGKIEESEKSYISEYSREMGISEYDLSEQIDVTAVAQVIGTKSSESVKRIFLLELVACANTDGDFAETEKELIHSLVNNFGLTETDLNTCLDLLAEYTKISVKLTDFVKGKK